MRTPGNEPLIATPEKQLQCIPDTKKVAKLDRQALQTLRRLHKDALPKAVKAVEDAQRCLSVGSKQDSIDAKELLKSAEEVLEDVKTEISREKEMEIRMRNSYNAWAGMHAGWKDVARKLCVKHDVCLKMIGEHDG